MTTELTLLKSWKLKIALLTAIVTPTVTATAAYFGLQQKIQASNSEMSERVSALELENEKSFADKASVKAIDQRTQRMEIELTEIKTLLRNRLR